MEIVKNGAVSKKLLKTLSVVTLLITSNISYSESDVFTNLRWDGYISQALIYTSDNNFFGNSDDSISTEFTELEFLFSASFLNDFQFSGSILSRRAGESDNGSLRVDHGFLTYTMLNDLNWTFGARAGRIKAPFGFYGETRDIAFTRPSILTPQQLYPEFARGLMFTLDGIDFHGQRNWNINSLSWQIALSKKDPSAEELEDLTKRQITGTPKSDLYGAARLLYDWDAGKVRLAISYGKLGFRVINQGYPDTRISTRAVVLSSEYNARNWQIVGEYSMTTNDIENLQSYHQNSHNDGASYYLQGTYRLSHGLEVLLRRGYLYLNKDDKSGKVFEAEAYADFMNGILDTPIPGYTQYAENWVIGAGWHINSDILLRAEYQIIEGTAWVPADDAMIQPLSMEKDWDMLMLQASYRF
ncbi:MAG: hypothetical protein D6B27_00085 [Gammaproteobacteria bacterium]|nr:MAG: hypothetical protein D6B27_00085 [Gammaproteobacteria bacterium]